MKAENTGTNKEKTCSDSAMKNDTGMKNDSGMKEDEKKMKGGENCQDKKFGSDKKIETGTQPEDKKKGECGGN